MSLRHYAEMTKLAPFCNSVYLNNDGIYNSFYLIYNCDDICWLYLRRKKSLCRNKSILYRSATLWNCNSKNNSPSPPPPPPESYRSSVQLFAFVSFNTQKTHTTGSSFSCFVAIVHPSTLGSSYVGSWLRSHQCKQLLKTGENWTETESNERVAKKTDVQQRHERLWINSIANHFV